MRFITLRVAVKCDSAHKLSLPYESRCNNLHGHCWHVGIEVEGPLGDFDDMLIDFSEIKKYMKQFDHCYFNDFIPNPTAENLARLWAQNIYKLGEYIVSDARDTANSTEVKNKFTRVKITVAETEDNVAEYTYQ